MYYATIQTWQTKVETDLARNIYCLFQRLNLKKMYYKCFCLIFLHSIALNP